MNKQKGFSLLEILVAFSILAIALTIILKIFSSGVNTAIVAEEYTIATQIAESLMAKTGIETPLVEGDSSGVEEEKYSWQVNVSALPALIDGSDMVAELKSVKVQVRWPNGVENFRTVELNSVKSGTTQ